MTAPIKVWNKESVQTLIATNDLAVARAIRTLYARQTADEKVSQQTKEHNGRGFNANDAPFLTSIAQRLDQYCDRMTPRQLETARRMLPKYWRQLLEAIQEEGRGVVDFKEQKKETRSTPLKPSALEAYASF